MATSIKVSETIEKLPANPFAFEVLNLASKQKSNAKKAPEVRDQSGMDDFSTGSRHSSESPEAGS